MGRHIILRSFEVVCGCGCQKVCPQDVEYRGIDAVRGFVSEPHKLREYDAVKTYAYYNPRKFRGQTFNGMHRWKSRGGKSQRREDKSRCRCRKIWKSRDPLCFSTGPQRVEQYSGPFGQMRDEKLLRLARSAFPSQNVQNTSYVDRFWKC